MDEAAARLLFHLVETLERFEIPYALAGSVAATSYGEPRSTRDIDVVVDLSVADLPRLGECFPADRFHFDEVGAAAAIEEGRQFNIIDPSSGLKIDVFVAADRIERHQIAEHRRRSLPGGRQAAFSPPEDLILKKLQYYAAGGSDKHLRDIAAVLDISGDEIDRERIRVEAAALGLSDLWSRFEPTD